jgi:transposase InsO family protein
VEDRDRDVALFRYALIREAADPALSNAERGLLVRALAAATHVGPTGERITVGRSTLDDWIRAWRAGGFEALVPRTRAIGPLTPSRVLALAEALKRELPARTAAQVHEIMVAAGEPVPTVRTLQALVMHAARSISADEVVGQLEALVARRGRAPRFLRMDNGPELTSHALRDWCRFSTAQTAFIEPGCPWQNPFVESFHARVRDELLNGEQFACIAEAQVLIDDWREDYNGRRQRARRYDHSTLAVSGPKNGGPP